MSDKWNHAKIWDGEKFVDSWGVDPPEPYVEPKRVRQRGQICGGSLESPYKPAIEVFPDDPDFDELIAAAQDVVETGLQSSDGRHCIVSEVAIERLRDALK